METLCFKYPILHSFHFTIRRYADVMVHRVLTAVLNDQVEELGLSIFDIEDILEHCNEKKTKSKEAQDRCDQTFFCLYIQGKDIISEACVIDWGDKSFELFIPEFGVSKRVHVDDLKCKMKATEESFILSPKEEQSESTKRGTIQISSDQGSAAARTSKPNNDIRGAPPAPTINKNQELETKPLVPDSKLKKLDKKAIESISDPLSDEMKKITIAQAESSWGASSDDNGATLPKFKSGS